ncbi:hypothetical protein B9Z55_026931 [Caenorhabditis nigoni]|nr:hypothetical protein B9Z55_026931 [Caenorhabditis nigoni]
MEQSSAVLKSNDEYMKTCILYEVIKKIPIFDSFRNFCETVGQDAMEYPDFEFWYYRFYHGQMDFDYDRTMDPEPKTLMDIPNNLLIRITENLDPVERTYLRSMNKSLKNIADSHAPVFKLIDICAAERGMYWLLNDKSFFCSRKDNGCLIKLPYHSEIKSDECHIKKGLEYLSPVLKMPNLQVNHISLGFWDETHSLEDLLPVPFHAKSIRISGSNINKSLQLLSFMNPGELESIHTNLIENEQILRFFETEQFKQAKSVHWENGLTEEDLVNFSYLKSFKLRLTSIGQVDYRRIRDTISTFKRLESCELQRFHLRNKFQIREICEALGEDVPFGPLKTVTHRYQIPESNEYLEFKIEDGEYYCTIKIIKIR